jgi:flagellar biosynthetic protein FliR
MAALAWQGLDLARIDLQGTGIEHLVAGISYVGVRIGGLMVFAPFTGSDAISISVKAVLTLVLTALIYPVSPPLVFSQSAAGWVKVVAGEAVIGMSLGLLLQFVFEAAQFAGQIFGIQTGFSLVTLLDPQTQADSSSLVVFTQLMTLVLFLEMNVHHWILRGVAASFNYLPPGMLGNLHSLTRGILHAAAGLWLAGLQIATPLLAATLLVEIALGFVGKAAPQLPATLAGLPVKSILGLLVLAAGAAGWPRFFEGQFTNAISQAEGLLHLAK